MDEVLNSPGKSESGDWIYFNSLYKSVAELDKDSWGIGWKSILYGHGRFAINWQYGTLYTDDGLYNEQEDGYKLSGCFTVGKAIGKATNQQKSGIGSAFWDSDWQRVRLWWVQMFVFEINYDLCAEFKTIDMEENYQ